MAEMTLTTLILLCANLALGFGVLGFIVGHVAGRRYEKEHG